MKDIILTLSVFSVIALSVISCKGKRVERKSYNEGINIIPIPLELTQNEGIFILSKDVVFVSPNEETDKIVSYFTAKIKNSTGYSLKKNKDKPNANYINLSVVTDIDVNNEGYLLTVDKKGVDIKAKTPRGLFYGMQTVMQLLPAEIESSTQINYIAWQIPAVTIKDEPRFKYRGQHLDVCRHFVDVDFIKKQLDVLAMFKINTFHWHLTEDQAWRIEIKKYPKLMEVSTKRTEGEGYVYGSFFYTQEQVKEIVAYAKERFIEVIPEIELPGHAVAALAAYPEFSCTGGPFEVRKIWGVSSDIYCAGDDSTFTFLEDVIAEVIPLFESEYFHIGGDEAPKAKWEACPKCQARIKALGLRSDKEHTAEERLQSYFVQRIEKFLTQHGKKMIGWDEILEGGLAPSATVMSWRGEEGGIAAGNMGHDVIMTPGRWLYLDAFQADEKLSPIGIGNNYIPIATTYSYDPVPDQLAKDKQHHILGVQANVWTEYMYEPEIIENYTYPRILALAEIAWSALSRKDYKDFERRLDNGRVRLDMHNINYFIPQPQDIGAPSCNFVAFVDSAIVALETLEPMKIVYTTDGTEPNEKSTEYKCPLSIKENTVFKTRSILLSGKKGEVRTITYQKQSYAPAVTREIGHKSGLKAEYYQGIMHKVAQLQNKIPSETEYIAAPQDAKHWIKGHGEYSVDENYNVVLSGYIDIPEDGIYFINTLAVQLWLDGKLLISNENTVVRQSHADSSIALAKGLHEIKMIKLSGIIGGWAPMWNQLFIKMRKSGEPHFTLLDASYYK